MERAAGTGRHIARWVLLVILCAPIYLYQLGDPGLRDPDEGRNAEVAREMLATRDYVMPHINGARYLDKPPAFFWMVTASYRIFGVGELAARMPSALAALAGVAIVTCFVARHLGGAAGCASGLILALSPLYIVFGRLVIFDMTLTLCMTVSALAAYRAIHGDTELVGPSISRHSSGKGSGTINKLGATMDRQGSPPLAGPIFFAAAGVGTLVKGPVALAAPLLVALAWALCIRRPGAILRLRWGWGGMIYLAIVLPWPIAIEFMNPGYLSYALLGENLGRLASNRFDTARPFYLYLKVILPGLFPWILYPAAHLVRRLLAPLRRRGAPVADAAPGSGPETPPRLIRYAAVWLGVLFLFFTAIASKRTSYILPCAVPVAIMAGHLWGAALGRGRRPVAVLADGRLGEETRAGREYRGRAVATGAGPDVILGSAWVSAICVGIGIAFALASPGGLLIGMQGGRYDPLLVRTGLFGWTAAGLILSGALLYLTRRSRRPLLGFGMAILSIAVVIPMGRAVGAHVESIRSSRELSRFLASRVAPEDTIVCFEEYRPGLNFYLRRPVHQVRRQGRVFTSNYIDEHVEEFRSRPSFRLIPRERFSDVLKSGAGQVFVISPFKEVEDLRALAGVPLRKIHEDAAGAVLVPARDSS